MSNRTGREKCDMQSDRENTYNASLFSNIEIIKKQWKSYKNQIKNTLSYEGGVNTQFSHIFDQFYLDFE